MVGFIFNIQGFSKKPHGTRLWLQLHAGDDPVRLAAVVAVDVGEDDPQARHKEAHAGNDEDDDARGDRTGCSSLDQVCEQKRGGLQWYYGSDEG